MSSPTVETSFADGSSNTVRPESMTYPNGRELTYSYGTSGSQNDRLSRVAAVVDDDDTTLVEYQYLGLGAVVQQDSPEADLRYTLVDPSGTNDPDTGDIYAGLDRFGRVKDVRWRDVSADSDLSRIAYGYDRGSNRTWRRNPSDPNSQYDWLYGYDGLHRLQDAQRGTLNGSQTAITSPQFAQCWTLDATGNWQGFRQADAGAGNPWDLVQTRLANPVNEISSITNSTGPAWTQPAYDPAGNMTTIPQPADPTAAYTATYDAWNRLVKLVDPATSHTVQEHEYDGRGFRIVRKDYNSGTLSETRHFYYTDGWRDVEERVGTSPDTANAERQFVWGLRYIDDLVLRDRSTARLYACQDANWNVIAVVDDAGDVQERYEYDPYGGLTVLSPAFVVRMASNFDWDTTYAGYRFDAATGLYAVRFRVLAPMLAWLQRDPLGYVNGASLLAHYRVVNTVDPYGLAWDLSDPQFAACYRGCVRRFERGEIFSVDVCVREECGSPPEHPPVGSRALTPQERQCLEAIFLAAYPGFAASERGQEAIATSLGSVTLWNAESIEGWHQINPYNLIAQSAVSSGSASAITLGYDQYYHPGAYPPPNHLGYLPLLGHEATHSLQAHVVGGAPFFIPVYAYDSLAAWAYEGDSYHGNFSEWHGHAMQSTIQDLLRDPAFVSYCQQTQCAALPVGLQNRIQLLFNRHLSSQMARLR